MQENIRRVRWRFTGTCQGVGFRWITQIEANKLGVVGWVQNQTDSSVIIEAQGSDEQLSNLYANIFSSYKQLPFKFELADSKDIDIKNDEDAFNVIF